MQVEASEIYSREHKSCDIFSYWHNLTEREDKCLGVIRLWYISYGPPLWTHLGMMTLLSERWHSETFSF